MKTAYAKVKKEIESLKSFYRKVELTDPDDKVHLWRTISNLDQIINKEQLNVSEQKYAKVKLTFPNAEYQNEHPNQAFLEAIKCEVEGKTFLITGYVLSGDLEGNIASEKVGLILHLPPCSFEIAVESTPESADKLIKEVEDTDR